MPDAVAVASFHKTFSLARRPCAVSLHAPHFVVCAVVDDVHEQNRPSAIMPHVCFLIKSPFQLLCLSVLKGMQKVEVEIVES